MARVTVEDCIEKVPNRFSLVLLAAHRARGISSGAPLLVDRDNDKNPVVALRELADDGKRPAKAPDAPTPRPSRSKPPRRASAPKAATPEALADDRITFTTPNGWVVHLNPFRQKKARGDK